MTQKGEYRLFILYCANNEEFIAKVHNTLRVGYKCLIAVVRDAGDNKLTSDNITDFTHLFAVNLTIYNLQRVLCRKLMLVAQRLESLIFDLQIHLEQRFEYQKGDNHSHHTKRIGNGKCHRDRTVL